ncbi:hypothetical protein, partial [Paenibacillus sp. VTT E-133280]|uniref:hypothetical protein n=1 Tax=Paenibacillus sp. VTT E-133280 TaxID=1986222 RepID=UPI001C52936C
FPQRGSRAKDPPVGVWLFSANDIELLLLIRTSGINYGIVMIIYESSSSIKRAYHPFILNRFSSFPNGIRSSSFGLPFQ